MANQPKKYKKFVATAATATLVASAIVPVASAASLSDIAGNTHEAAINALVDAGVINGYADGTFKPNKELTRSDVVKLLGKYLVTQGHEVPADATSNPRFSDLSSKTNKELLEYAAVVADAGVFAGSNGKLLAGDPITRENMAIVLVRMVNTLNDVSLEEFVASQDFNREVKDINAAKAEARTAIDVLDFYDITTVANFLPKNTVTRGQFATFLNNVINADFAGATVTGTVKAINATTVEVTFADEVADIKALDFKIEGLEVSNAVVKQTDKKTVVLTTSPQTAGTEYTVTVNGNAVGKFTGVSAVIPTKVELVSSSVQGKLGQQVTVQAKVTVAEGASKAGIPVTFSIPGNNNDGVKPTVTGEAFTNAEGVATYTYTRYAATTDAVTAYATGDRSKFAIGYVFWGVEQILTITEVTEGATINNGANKTYKVTYKNPETGKPEANVSLNVGVLENMNVTADKLQNVSVNGVKVQQLSNNTKTQAAQITTDSKGEATFTVSGTNAEVTPVVFEANNTRNASNALVVDHKYDASDLQTTAAKVKFAAVQAEYTIELARDGGEVAATGEANGREYKIIVKDKDGKVAKNETVNVAFNEDLDRVIATNTKSGFVNPDTEKFYPTTAGAGVNTKKQISVKTNAKGEATFIIASNDENDYATPIAWIDINTSDAKQGALDESEPKKVGEISHFQAPYLDGAAVKAYNASNKAQTKFDGSETAEFKAELVNQSGKVFTGGYTLSKVTYTVFNTGDNDVIVNGTIISPNRSETFTTNGAGLKVNAVGSKTTAVRVVATGSAYKDGKDFAFTAKEATATFTNSQEIGAEYTGYLKGYDTDKKTLTFNGKNAVKYAGESGKTYEYYGTNGAPIIGSDNFINALVAAADINNDGSGDTAVRATYRVVDNVVKFYLLDTTTTAGFFTEKLNTAPANGVLGVLTLTSSSTSTTTVDAATLETLTVQLADADLNTNTDAVETATVSLRDVNGSTTTLTLVETGNNTGAFSTVLTSGQLKSLAAGTLTVTYNDAKNASNVAQTVSRSIVLKTTAGAVSSGAFAQAVAASPAKAANDYVSKAIPVDYTFASGEGFALNVDGTPNPINLQGKTGAQGVADAINSVFPGRATVSGNTVTIKSATTGTSSVVEVSSSTTTYLLNVTSNTGTNAVTTPTAATKEFTITAPLADSEKIYINGTGYTVVGATEAAQAANLATQTIPGFTVVASGSTVKLTSTSVGTEITNPVITVK